MHYLESLQQSLTKEDLQNSEFYTSDITALSLSSNPISHSHPIIINEAAILCKDSVKVKKLISDDTARVNLDEIESYFNSLQNKPLKITINGNSFPDLSDRNTNSEIFPSDSPIGLHQEESIPAWVLVGCCPARVQRRKLEWSLSLRNALIHRNGQELFYSIINIKINPDDIVPIDNLSPIYS